VRVPGPGTPGVDQLVPEGAEPAPRGQLRQPGRSPSSGSPTNSSISSVPSNRTGYGTAILPTAPISQRRASANSAAHCPAICRPKAVRPAIARFSRDRRPGAPRPAS
jgi:hypothetical protein